MDRETLEPMLYSTYVNFPWDCAEVSANMPPEHELDESGKLRGHLGSLHGIHAVLTEHDSTWITDWKQAGVMIRAFGAVDVFGTVVEHKDGVVRAEGAKILALRVYSSDPDLGIAWNRAESAQSSWHTEFPGREGDYQVCVDKPHFTGNGYVFEEVEAQPVPMNVDELEALLLRKYDVPLMDLGRGPWYEPVGTRVRTP